MASPAAKLDRSTVERVYRVRPLQAGMLFHDLLTPGVAPYYRAVTFTILGEVDAQACEAAWNGLLARHPLLRAVFDYERTDQALQIILKTRTIEFHAEDLADCDAGARIAAWCHADAARGFDLRRDCLIRVALFRVGPAHFQMVWTHPHILIDGWSGAILAEEFTALYAAARMQTPPQLPPAPDPDNYMAMLAARDDDAATRYWTQLLAGYEEVASLPRRASDSAPDLASYRFALAQAPVERLATLASAHDTTLGIILQALWSIILARWVGRDDVVFGIVTSGRTVAARGVDRLVGMFINTIPVRATWSRTDTLATLLARLQHQAFDAAQHDHLGLAAIHANSALPAGVFDHLLVFENFPAASSDVGATGFAVTATTARERANYDFGIIVQSGDGLEFTIQHDPARMPLAMLQRLEAQWRTLIDALLARPEQPLSAIDLLPAAEQRILAALEHGPCVQRDPAATLVDLWHEQADRTPDAPALVAGTVRLSYTMLDQRAEGVADRLRRDNIGHGDVVGVLAARGADRLVALLGILKAGAIYLPISPSLPDRRIADMIADSACRRVLADADGLARAHAIQGAIGENIAAPAVTHRASSGATADATAYIIYTSGSTGRPKGVAVAHHAFVNMILAQIDGFGIEPGDRVLQFASCSFDASLSEIFMALLRGACLVVAPETAIRDGDALLQLIADEYITVATLPPSYLRALDHAELAPLRVLITAGEAPDLADSRHYARRLALFNAYGPTENAVCASWHRVAPDGDYPAGIPIGRAIANTAMSIRDRNGRRMPRGATGEIWLSGAGLAEGYVGQPALTAERFPTRDGARFYRTGDIGLLRDDGEMLYFGRIDSQTKLNGHRIELGEIEQRLRDHPAVAQAVVLIAANPPRLAAFVVPRAPLDLDAVRRSLAEVLPAWMVPASITPLTELPVTIAGKIDRRALLADTKADVATDLPLDAIEAMVADAFKAVLGCETVGRDSGFVALGGDSLRAIRLMGRLRRAGLAIALHDLLAADSVAAIARMAFRPEGRDTSADTGRVPLTPIQRGYFANDPDGTARFNHHVLLETGSTFDPTTVRTALTALWERHDSLRLRFGRDGDWHAEIADATAAPPYRQVDLGAAADPSSLIAANVVAHQPAPAASGETLLSATHFQHDKGDLLLLSAHHLLVDAVSWRVLLEDLEQALAQATTGAPPRLPAPAASYAEWARTLASVESLAAAERERPYWQTVIAAVPQCHAVAPHGYDDTALLTADLGPVPAGTSDRAVLAMLLARIANALSAIEGSATVAVTLTGHGRHALVPAIDVSRTVGWFSVEYPFIVAAAADAAEIAAALAAVPSQGVGWMVLRWLSTTPPSTAEPAISVNYLGEITTAADSALVVSDRLPGVTTRGLRRTRRIEIEAHQASGRLHVALRYAPHIDTPSRMQTLLDAITHVGAAAPVSLPSESIMEGT